MNNRLLIIALILITGTVGFLGVLAVEGMQHTTPHTCPVTLFSGATCPPDGNIMALASHHLSGFQSLSQAVMTNFSPAATGVVLLLVLFALAVVRLLLKRLSNSVFFFQYRRQNQRAEFQANKRFLRWLELCYKRDPYMLLMGV